ncbi:MAG: glycosyltransferase family 2 protein [Planctomycetaceae bacterium]|nr:glycosyltransferase family 2 protein [Planctomycetaceae bacterium]
MDHSLNNMEQHPVHSLSVFFPCYNEAAAIRPLTEKAVSVLSRLCGDYEIILVDDGSADGTGQLADELAAEYANVRVVHHPRNKGYGAALQSGFRAAKKEYVFYTDGDGQFDLEELPALLPLMSRFDVVSAYRINRQEGLVRKVNAWCWTKLVCFLFGMKLKDIDCAFKLYRRKIFDEIEMVSTGALIDTEILARLSRKGYTITQVGVHHYPRIGGKPTGANIKVILRAFRELLKLRKKILET